jgi:hypothetical protein
MRGLAAGFVEQVRGLADRVAALTAEQVVDQLPESRLQERR